MSIQSLPVELLQCIFDKLAPRDRATSTLVCRQWFRVLRSDHYIRRMTLTVTSRNLRSRDFLRRMRRRPFRKLNIEDEDEGENESFLTWVRKLLESKSIRRNVSEVRFVGGQRALNAVFVGHQMTRALRFGKLSEIVYTPGSRLEVHEEITPAIRLRVPNLTVLKIDVFTRAAVELVRMASRGLESLSMRFFDKVALLDVLEMDSFGRLRYAGLFAVSNGKKDFAKLSALDFRPGHRATLAKLDSLEVRDGVNMFGDVFDVVFRGATNLVQLYVSGVDMSPSALASVHDMKKLKRLHLYIFSLLPRGVNF